MPGTLSKSEFRSQNRQHASNMKSMLSSGYLDTFGPNRFGPKPIAFNALEEVLLKYAELFVKGFAEELDKDDSNASGAGTDSIRFEFTKLGTAYDVSIFMFDYLKYKDEGVQGITSNALAPNSPFKFKFTHPSAGHIAALEKWIKDKNVRAIITVPKGILTEAAKQKSLAYAIGYSIKQRGLRATHFKKKVVERLIDDMKAEIALAAGDDMKINILF